MSHVMQIRRVRHFLRSGHPEKAAEIIEAWRDRPEGYMFYPYASIIWRLLDPERWEWLEGHESFVGVYDIADRLPPLDELAKTLRGLHKLSGHPLEQSLRGGTQTDGDIFMRIDPVRTSGPTGIVISTSASASRPEPGLMLRYTVRALRSRARASAPWT